MVPFYTREYTIFHSDYGSTMERPISVKDSTHVLADLCKDEGERQTQPLEDAVDPKLPELPLLGKDGSPRGGKLFRQTYLLVIVSLYSCLSIIAWVMICVQSRRPITYKSYRSSPSFGPSRDQMRSNAQWFRAIKVVLSATYTLIIPLTSTVCASAAVIYVQHFGQRRQFRMQQTSALADKGWISPQVWLALLRPRGWKSQGSSFLAFAIALHALGTSNSPC